MAPQVSYLSRLSNRRNASDGAMDSRVGDLETDLREVLVDPAVTAVATIVDRVAFQSEDPAVEGYLRPTADSSASLRAVGGAFPGRFESE